MFNFKNFFDGWRNYFIDNPDLKEIIEARAKHCEDCVFSVKGLYLDWIKDDIKEIEGYKCDVCDCPLSALLRATESECEHPDGSKWKDISTSE